MKMAVVILVNSPIMYIKKELNCKYKFSSP